jgi:Ca2+-binding RTX toxin-like protein
MSTHFVRSNTLRSVSALVLGLGLAVPIALAATAGAATASATAGLDASGKKLIFMAAAGQANHLKVTETTSSSGDVQDISYLFDDVVPITAGTGCSYPDSGDQTKVTCTVPNLPVLAKPYTIMTMALGDGNDYVDWGTLPSQTAFRNSIYLGTGNDKFERGGTTDTNDVYGQAGNDVIRVGSHGVAYGGDGDDMLYAVGDDSEVNGGKGNDYLHGGIGGPQRLNGDDGNDSVYGLTGIDLITGGKGNDVLYGGSGTDVIYGNSGNDKLYGEAGADNLYGGPGNDRLYGGTGTDMLNGGPGKNSLHQS